MKFKEYFDIYLYNDTGIMLDYDPLVSVIEFNISPSPPTSEDSDWAQVVALSGVYNYYGMDRGIAESGVYGLDRG